MLGTLYGIDWVIVGLYLAIVIGIGVFVKRYVTGLDNYLAAGKSLGIGLSIATMIGTELGLVTIAYGSQRGFLGGFAGIHTPLIAMLMCVVIGLTGFIVYRLRKAGIITLPEFYQQRYGRKTRIVGGIILVVSGVLNMGMFLKVSALFVAGITGFEGTLNLTLLSATVHVDAIAAIMVILLLLVFAYIVIGGMLSVVLIDYLQFILIGSAFVIVTFMCWGSASYTAKSGEKVTGWKVPVYAVIDRGVAKGQEKDAAEATAKARDAARKAALGGGAGKDEAEKAAAAVPALDANSMPPRKDYAEGGFNPFLGQGSYGIVYVLWTLFSFVTLLALWQPATLRALIAENPNTAKRTYLWSSLGFLIRFAVPILWGTFALAYIMGNPDLKEMFFPASGGQGKDTLMATPIFLAHLLPTGYMGVVMAGLLAAFMSTQGSYLFCWSASLTQDIVGPFSRGTLSPKVRVNLTRVFLVLLGLFLLAWGLWFPLEGEFWDYLLVSANIYSAGAAAAVGLGLYWKRASSAGAVTAMLLGGLAVLGVLPWKHWGVNSVWVKTEVIGALVLTASVVGMVVVSLLFPDRKKETGNVL